MSSKSNHKHIYSQHLQQTGQGLWSIVNVCSVCGKLRGFTIPCKRLPNGYYLMLSSLSDIRAEYGELPILEKKE